MLIDAPGLTVMLNNAPAIKNASQYTIFSTIWLETWWLAGFVSRAAKNFSDTVRREIIPLRTKELVAEFHKKQVFVVNTEYPDWFGALYT